MGCATGAFFFTSSLFFLLVTAQSRGQHLREAWHALHVKTNLVLRVAS